MRQRIRDDEIQPFLDQILKHVEDMQQQSYILLKDHTLNVDDEVYDRVYKINQSGHEIKKLLSQYKVI